jgi:hypothetical protein
MFFLMTILTLWILLLFDPADLQQPIAPHNLNSLHFFIPGSVGSIILWGGWVFALAMTPKSLLAPGSTNEGFLRQWGGFTSVLLYGIFTALALCTAVAGWLFGIASALLVGSILTLGLIGNYIEQKGRRP